MNRRNYYLLIFILLITNFQLFSQYGECGTTVETQNTLLAQRFSPFKSRNAVTYIPLRFSIIRNDDGNGGPTISNILDQMTVLNNDFKGANIQFYFADGPNFNFINNTKATNDPGSSNSLLLSQKNNQAVNVFITKFAIPSNLQNGIVQGFYTPNGDFLVVIDSEITKRSNTLSHEMGHYFSLSHTFLGWDNDPYDEAKHGNPVTLATIGGQNIETVNKSNCSYSADQICDTPPDYNFGYTASGCVFNRIVKDRNGDTIRTQINNQMSYFNNCSNYIFTQGQNDRMNSSLFSPSRFSINKNYSPNIQPITGNLLINFPKANTTVQSFNNVSFDWDNIPNAQYYLFTYSDGRNTVSLVTTNSELVLKDLKANATYFYTIRPFSEGYTDTKSVTTLFKTGNVMTAVQDLDQKNTLEIYPNPIRNKLQGINISLVSNKSNDIQLQIVDATGRQISNSRHKIQSGNNTINLSTASLSKGIYFARIIGDLMDLQKKFVVLE